MSPVPITLQQRIISHFSDQPVLTSVVTAPQVVSSVTYQAPVSSAAPTQSVTPPVADAGYNEMSTEDASFLINAGHEGDNNGRKLNALQTYVTTLLDTISKLNQIKLTQAITSP